MSLQPKLWAAAQNNTADANDKIRGVMVDAARVVESMAYYRRVVEFCAEWELNTLQFRLTDDQGSALHFASVPDLVMHRHAYTPEELHGLVEFGRAHGVDVIPEVEAFGHTGYITRSPKYAHLLDRDPQGSAEFTGMIPVDPETLAIMEKLFRETAEIFPSKYLHGGCDEVNWGGSALSRKALETKTRAQIWGEYLNALNKIALGLRKTFIVWGDLVLQKEPEILGRLDKSIVIMDWNYWDTNAAKFRDALEKVRAHGARGIGAPGLISYRWGPRPGTTQLRNIDAYADVYVGSGEAASLGIVLANWVPSRYIQNSLWDGFAYAAVAFKNGSAAAGASGMRRFVERHFGTAWNENWSQALQTLWDAAPIYGEKRAGAEQLRLIVPYRDEEGLAACLKHGTQSAQPFTRVRGLLAQVGPAVKKNREDFAALALSVQYLEALYWRENVIQERAAGQAVDQETARVLIDEIAARDRQMAEALTKDWDSGRPADSEAKIAPLFGMEAKDQLLFSWQRAAAFTARLAGEPGRFLQMLQRAGLG